LKNVSPTVTDFVAASAGTASTARRAIAAIARESFLVM
jgi:hypothetical protein